MRIQLKTALPVSLIPFSMWNVLILRKITECVFSLYNENVLTYMEQVGLDISLLKMNVIVQRMVNADVSGIIFTANPQGILNESVIVRRSSDQTA